MPLHDAAGITLAAAFATLMAINVAVGFGIGLHSIITKKWKS